MNLDDKMKEAISLFASNNHAVQEIIKRGRKQGLSEAQTRAGMVRVLERIQEGENIKPIRMVWQAWAEAKQVHGDDFRAMEHDKRELRGIIAKGHKHRDWAIEAAIVGWTVAIILAIHVIWGV
jgi:hypothetical protein